jgi:hypothetical protein
MAKKKTARRSSPARKTPTVQRTYRFGTDLFERFEEDCAKNLANPKLVIEAALLYYLDGDQTLRQQIAQNHREQFGTSAGYRSSE